MKIRLLCIIFLIALILITLTGCIPGDGTYSEERPAGFFWGIWHGWLAPISLIISIFKGNISIYEHFNTGWWYNFGYYISIISGFGGLSIIRKKRYKNSNIRIDD